jgi:hypothetical protein
VDSAHGDGLGKEQAAAHKPQKRPARGGNCPQTQGFPFWISIPVLEFDLTKYLKFRIPYLHFSCNPLILNH